MCVLYAPVYRPPLIFAIDVSLMDSLRQVLHSGLLSKEVLDLTSKIIQHNASFYTAWILRLKSLDFLASMEGPQVYTAELDWLNELTLSELKSYQVWQHRRVVVANLPVISSAELEVLDSFLSQDAKNIHLWSYR